jgi:hypothetical protein
MAFKLALANYTAGLEPNAAKELATLKYFNTLTPPVTESVMRTDLETGQFQAFSNDGWLAFMTQMANVSLDESALTVSERTIINTIRAVVTPEPEFDCCGVAPIVEALTTAKAFKMLGFPAFQHEFEFQIDGTVDCAVRSVEITLVPIGIAPAITSANPFKVTFKECSGGVKLLSKIDVTFAADPAGEAYDITLVDALDVDDLSITTFNPVGYNWNIPV